MAESFNHKLAAAVERNNSLVCVGLDPDPALMAIPDVANFNRAIIEATADLVCCYKPNIAFYEAMGQDGWDALRATLAAIPGEIPVLVDAKRGDIGNSSVAYARAIFDVLGADAMTINAWGGEEAVEPFLEYESKGVFIWCRSSNFSAGDFQDLEVDVEGRRRPLWQAIALKANGWNQTGNLGIVMGATYPEQLQQARQLCPDMPFLVPGVGAQDGSLRDSVRAGLNSKGEGMIINASRSIIYASGERNDFAMAARAAALLLRDEINRHRANQVVTLEG